MASLTNWFLFEQRLCISLLNFSLSVVWDSRTSMLLSLYRILGLSLIKSRKGLRKGSSDFPESSRHLSSDLAMDFSCGSSELLVFSRRLSLDLAVDSGN